MGGARGRGVTEVKAGEGGGAHAMGQWERGVVKGGGATGRGTNGWRIGGGDRVRVEPMEMEGMGSGRGQRMGGPMR